VATPARRGSIDGVHGDEHGDEAMLDAATTFFRTGNPDWNSTGTVDPADQGLGRAALLRQR